MKGKAKQQSRDNGSRAQSKPKAPEMAAQNPSATGGFSEQVSHENPSFQRQLHYPQSGGARFLQQPQRGGEQQTLPPLITNLDSDDENPQREEESNEVGGHKRPVQTIPSEDYAVSDSDGSGTDPEAFDQYVAFCRSHMQDNELDESNFFEELFDARKEVECPICLGIIKKTRVVMGCLHRFCKECIDKSMRLGNNECPACRMHCASRRSLRDDPGYDAIISAIYADLEKHEQEEQQFDEDEKARNEQIQASIAKISKRQSQALNKRRRKVKASPGASSSYSERRRGYRLLDDPHSEHNGEENDDETRNLALIRAHQPEIRRKKRNRHTRPSTSQYSPSGADDVECSGKTRELLLGNASSSSLHMQNPGLADYDEVGNEDQVGNLAPIDEHQPEIQRKKHKTHKRPFAAPPSISNNVGYGENTAEHFGRTASSLSAFRQNQILPGWGRQGSRSNTRQGRAATNKPERSDRLSRLVNHLEETNDTESDVLLKLVPFDEDVPSLSKPFISCSPQVSLGELCEYVAIETRSDFTRVEFVVLKEKKAGCKSSAYVPNLADIITSLHADSKIWFKVMDRRETLADLLPKFDANNYLVLTYALM